MDTRKTLFDRPEDAEIFKRVVLPIFAVGHSATHIVGTCFVVHQINKRTALLMTAGHVLMQVAKLDPSLRRVFQPALPGFETPPSQLQLKHFQILVSVYAGGTNMPLGEVIRGSMNHNHDVALIVVRIPDEIEVPDDCFGWKLAINSAPPVPGTPIIGLDYSQSVVLEGHGDERSVKLVARECWGSITEICPQGNRLVKAPGFNVNMPFHSGMSGGPIVDVTIPARPAVRGIVSSDLSDITTGEGSGTSAFASSTISAYGIDTNMIVQLEDGRSSMTLSLPNLIRTGFLVDPGVGLQESTTA